VSDVYEENSKAHRPFAPQGRQECLCYVLKENEALLFFVAGGVFVCGWIGLIWEREAVECGHGIVNEESVSDGNTAALCYQVVGFAQF
jgi:hypothetical protein